jgi:4-amino-4-deoxy-L-arabinose transferase-like glycosyltransferase
MHYATLALILALGLTLRLYEFGSVPPGLNQDEASTGYEAFSIMHYGIDRNGFHLPAVLESFGSGQNALATYLAIPLFWLFGVSVASLRAVNMLGGIAALPAFYLLVRRGGDKTLALLATFLLAISPWAVMASRSELEENLLPWVFLLGVLFLSRGEERPNWYYLAAFFFAATLYCYGTAYLVTPLFLAAVAISFVRWRPRSWKPIAGATALLCVLATPIVLYVAINKLELGSIRTPILSIPRLASSARFHTEFTGTGQIGTNLHAFWRLLVSGNDGLIWNDIPGYPYLYHVGVVLALLGLIVTFVRRGLHPTRVEFLFLAWLGSSVVLAAMVVINVNHVNIVFIPLIYFAAVGIRAVVVYIPPIVLGLTGTRAMAASRLLLAGFLVYFSVSLVQFADRYFGSYKAEASHEFFAGLGPAIKLAAASTAERVCITGEVNEPYIFVLFYLHVDPHVFLRSVVYSNPGAESQWVSSFDRYTFGLGGEEAELPCNPATTGAYVVAAQNEGSIDQSRFAIVGHYGQYVVALRR